MAEISARIETLASMYPNMTQPEIAHRVGCTQQYVSEVLIAFLSKNNEEKLRDFQANRADCQDAVALQLLESVTQDDLRKVPTVAKLTGYGILTDKSAVMRGQATSINVTAFVDVVAALRELRRRGDELPEDNK